MIVTGDKKLMGPDEPGQLCPEEMTACDSLNLNNMTIIFIG